MSRGALLLHSVATNKELRYLPISRARQIDHCRNPKKIGFMMGVGVCATLISFVWQYFLSSIGENLARSRGTTRSGTLRCSRLHTSAIVRQMGMCFSGRGRDQGSYSAHRLFHACVDTSNGGFGDFPDNPRTALRRQAP